MSNYTNNLFDPKVKNNSWVHLYDYVPEGSRVLDVGCSSGNFGEVLIHEKKCKVIGLDIDAPDIKLAKEHLTDAFVRNIEHDDISDLGKFDIVIFADVLEHLLDPITALNKVKGILAPKGKILFSIPNMAHISIRLMLLKGFFEYTPIGVLDRTHLHYYDEFEVEHIFTGAQLKIEEINAVTKPYPKSKISEELGGMGLAVADEKFFDRINESKGQVFQFVGYAIPSDGKVEERQRPIRYRLPPEELHLTLQARDDELQYLGKKLRELQEKMITLQENYVEARDINDQIEEQSAWFQSKIQELEESVEAIKLERDKLKFRNMRLKQFYDKPISGLVKRASKKIAKTKTSQKNN